MSHKETNQAYVKRRSERLPENGQLIRINSWTAIQTVYQMTALSILYFCGIIYNDQFQKALMGTSKPVNADSEPGRGVSRASMNG
jgi:hypothetical protein